MGAERGGWVLAWKPSRRDGDRPSVETELAGDPVGAILDRSLRGHALPPRRWAVAPDIAAAVALLETADPAAPRLSILTGDAGVDGLLAGIAPALPALLDDLTSRQREIGGLLLLDGLHQAGIARRLGVSRPTISVAVARGHLREIDGLAGSVRALLGRSLLDRARTRATR